MIYVTTRQKEYEKQLTWLDMIEEKYLTAVNRTGTAGTITRTMEQASPELLNKINVPGMIRTLQRFNERHKDLYDTPKEKLYKHYNIPKKTGGWRPIDEPCSALQNSLQELKEILVDQFGVLYHTAAYAYVPGRSIVQNNRKHQINESNWYLKTDFSGFFPSTTLDFTMNMLSMVFPLSEVCKDPVGREELRKALSLGFLRDSLPQGSKLSPTLTNCLMIPVDHKLFNALAKKRYVYTRYADDIHISCVQKFNYQKMVQFIRDTLKEFDAPYQIKDEKTHFGSRKGRNFCLGLLINADNNITVGHQKKRLFKAATNNLIMDWKHHKYWDIADLQHYSGLLSYYKMVEPEYFKNLIRHFNTKYHVNVSAILKQSLT